MTFVPSMTSKPQSQSGICSQGGCHRYLDRYRQINWWWLIIHSHRHSSSGQAEEGGCSERLSYNRWRRSMQGQAIARAERGAREGMETESNSGPHGNWNHGGSDPKTGGSSKSSWSRSRSQRSLIQASSFTLSSAQPSSVQTPCLKWRGGYCQWLQDLLDPIHRHTSYFSKLRNRLKGRFQHFVEPLRNILSFWQGPENCNSKSKTGKAEIWLVCVGLLKAFQSH